jgi:inhibitor of cysteine peptidase
VQGSFPDGCTSLGEVTQTVEDNTISVTLTGDQPEGLMCAQALTPFEETIPLDVSGLPAGEYTVDVNGSTTMLVLPADQ